MAMQMLLHPILREQNALLEGTGPYVSLDVMNKEMLHVQVIRQGITQIYLLGSYSFCNGRKKSKSCLAFKYAGLTECS